MVGCLATGPVCPLLQDATGAVGLKRSRLTQLHDKVSRGATVKRADWLKVLVSCTAVLLALLRLLLFEAVGKRVDGTVLLLFAIAVAVFIIPWKSVTTFKGWGIELILDRTQVKGALEAAGLKRLKNTPLWKRLSELEPEIQTAQGSRVLWIDDNPHEILPERRILRALGIDVVTASDSGTAESILKQDDDFDMIISDVQRKGEIDHRDTRYGGIYFIKELREKYEKNAAVKSMPVIFYTAYRPDQITKIKQQVGEASLDEAQFIGSFDVLLPAVITMLSRVRSSPVAVEPQETKKGTPVA